MPITTGSSGKPVIVDNAISSVSFNSRDPATLAADAVFQGVGEDVSKYARVGVSIVTDNATDGVLTMEVSRDNITWGGPTRTWADTRFAQPHMWNIVEKYFRIKYTNGTTEATNLAIQVQYSTNSDILLGHQLDEQLSNETEAIAVKSVVVGQEPDGTYTNEPRDGVSFTTTSLLANAATYNSGVKSTDGYTQAQTMILASHDGTITVTSYSDSAGTDTIRTLNVPYMATDGFTVIASILFGPYTQWSFTNDGGVTQTDFFYSTVLATKALSGQMLTLDAATSPKMIANLVKSVTPQILNTDNSETVTSADAQVASPWQGDWTETRGKGAVRILTVLAATDNTLDGLGGTFIFEFSEDGISHNGISESRTILDFQTVRDFDLINAGRYYRCSYEPDRALSSDSVFITTTLRTTDDGAFVRVADQQIEKGNAAMSQSFSYLKGFKPDGRSADVLMNPEGQLIFSEYNVEVARGNIGGATSKRIVGRNASVGTTEQILWNGGAAYTFLTTAATVRVKAGNTNDTSGGSGAREVTVVGLDETGAEVTETLATAGTSASSATTATFIRINDFHISQAGTYATGAIASGANTAALSIETSGGTLLGTMIANSGVGTIGIYSIPLGKKGYFQRIRVTPEGNKSVTFRMWTRKTLLDSTAPLAPKMLRAEWVLLGSQESFNLTHPFEMDALEEVWVTGKTSSGNSAASTAFEIELIDD